MSLEDPRTWSICPECERVHEDRSKACVVVERIERTSFRADGTTPKPEVSWRVTRMGVELEGGERLRFVDRLEGSR